MKISFADLTKQVNFINDLILSDLKCDDDDASKQANSFTKHLMTTKYWFSRISWVNKKKYLLTLLQDVRSAWTLSLLLKSSWNCRPKDSVMSISQLKSLSSFDEVPLDHNRTALPVSILAQVMKNDRIWFLSLEPELQAFVLCELLPVGGGPVMWELMRRARTLYERYSDKLVENIRNCIVVNDGQSKRDLKSAGDAVHEDLRKPTELPGKAQKELDIHLATWNATIKSIRDSQKLEELEMTFNDGTTRKMWKVNRPRPEVVETVDFLQQLPSAIGKRILSYLPRAQLGDYARVNKYWSYLVDELRIELAARLKLDADFEKLNDLLLRYDTSVEMFLADTNSQVVASSGIVSTGHSMKMMRHPVPSVRASEKSGGAYSLRFFLSGKLNKPIVAQRPIRNMKDLTERLERRGAADENLWKWCEAIQREAKANKNCTIKDVEGVLALGNVHFPCPYMKLSVDLPLIPPLYKDPVMTSEVKPKRNPSNATVLQYPKEHPQKRYSLWTRDLSTLYPVFKIPSHQSPI